MANFSWEEESIIRRSNLHPLVKAYIAEIDYANPVIISALDTLVKTWDSSGFLSKIKMFLPIVTDKLTVEEQAAQCRINLMDLEDVVADPNFDSSTFSTTTGLIANSLSGDELGKNVGYWGADALNYTISASVFNNVDNNLSVINGFNTQPSINPRRSNQLTFWTIRTSGLVADGRIRVGNSNSIATYLSTITPSENLKGFKNTTKVGEAVPQPDWIGYGSNINIGNSIHQSANFMVGLGLTEAEASSYQASVIAFNNAIGRTVS